ncbi:MAG: hypothetical protein ACFFD6_03965 [Candidatus Thorarchaeota archaeon]
MTNHRDGCDSLKLDTSKAMKIMLPNELPSDPVFDTKYRREG